MTKSDAIKVIEILEKKGNVTTEEVKEIVEMIDEPVSYQPAPIIVKPYEAPNIPYPWTITCGTKEAVL
jgi:hypothetical protein